MNTQIITSHDGLYYEAIQNGWRAMQKKHKS